MPSQPPSYCATSWREQAPSGASAASDAARTLRRDGPREPERYPAQVVQPTKGFLRFFVDSAAAAKLAPRES